MACLMNFSDGDIVNWFLGIAISPLSYYRCCDNPDQVRTMVDYQIHWSIIFAQANKHKPLVQNILPKYFKDTYMVNLQGGNNSIELEKLRPGQDPNNKEHSPAFDIV